jgi:hypothetical protein
MKSEAVSSLRTRTGYMYVYLVLEWDFVLQPQYIPKVLFSTRLCCMWFMMVTQHLKILGHGKTRIKLLRVQ